MMSATLMLYKPIKAYYTPGEIDRMTDSEFKEAAKAYFDGKTDKWPDTGFWTPENKQYSDDVLYFVDVANYAHRRNRYASRNVRRLLTMYSDFLADRCEWLLPRESLFLGKKTGRYVIPVLEYAYISVECRKRFYRRVCTERYAFTREEAVRMMRENLSGSQKGEWMQTILSKWEDGMLLMLQY